MNEFQRELGKLVDNALKGLPLPSVSANLKMVAFELDYKFMRHLERENETPIKQVVFEDKTKN